jgi:hypothetical protein
MGNVNFYIGTSLETQLPYELLRRSILGYCQDAKIFPCPEYTSETRHTWSTPFSFNRLAIPFHSEFNKADISIYIDSDMLILGELVEMLEIAAKHPLSICRHVGFKGTSSVMAFNSKYLEKESYRLRVEKQIRNGVKSVDEIVFSLEPSIEIPSYFNSLDWIDENTKIVHFTYMPTQPWINKKSRYFPFYKEYLRGKILAEGESGPLVEVLTEAVNEFYVHPALAEIIDGEVSIRCPSFFIPYWIGLSGRAVPRMLYDLYRVLGKRFWKKKLCAK